MFDIVFDARRAQSSRGTGTAVSLVAHATAIIVAVSATSIGPEYEPGDDAPEDVPVVWRAPVVTAPPAQSPAVPAHPFVSMTPPVLIAPVAVPDALPPVDPTRSPLPADGLFVLSTAPGLPPGPTRTGTPGLGYAHDLSTVDKPAVQIAGAGAPAYPELLRMAGVEGEVLATFVVDTTGRAEPGTLRIVRASRPEFADAVRKSLKHLRFLPAEAVGRKVRQLVELPFVFSIR